MGQLGCSGTREVLLSALYRSCGGRFVAARVRSQRWSVSEGWKATIANANTIVDPITHPGGIRGPRMMVLLSGS